MLKRTITLGILSLTLACGSAQTALGPDQIDAPAVCTECTTPDCTCQEGGVCNCAEPCGQATVESVAVPSEETNTVEVSSTARRMRQLEKAKNLKENDSFGGSLTLIAMVIVISALILLSILFMFFGKISQHLLKKNKHENAAKRGKEIDESNKDLASGETIAAIGMALAEHFGQGHDIEDTILTIHQIKKAYSPWNSKIYNLRVQPEHHRNVRK